MAAVTRLGLYGGPRAPYAGFVAAAASVAVTVGALTEAQIVAGGQTIVLTLTNDTWVASGATFNAVRQALIDGLDSAQSESTGWNAEVRDKEVVGAVVRTSDTVVTITLTAAAAYDITATETITATVDASALTTSSIDVTGSPTFTVTAVVEETTTSTGGWTTRALDRETAKERAARERAERERLGIIEVEVLPEPLPTIALTKEPDTALLEDDISRLTAFLENMEAQDDLRKKRAAVLLLLV